MTVHSSFGPPSEDEKEKEQALTGTEAVQQEPLQATQEPQETSKAPTANEKSQAMFNIKELDEWSYAEDLLPDVKTALVFGIAATITGMIKMFSAMFTAVMLGRRSTLLLASTSASMVWTEPIDEFTRAFGLQVGALGAQACGAGNYPLVGTWTQMSLLLVCVIFIPTMLVKMSTGWMLEFVGVGSDLAEPAGWWATTTSYTMILELWIICLCGFTIARGNNIPDMVISISFCFFFNIVLWYLTTVYEVELLGCAVLTIVRRFLHLLGLFFILKTWGFFGRPFWMQPTMRELFQKHRWWVLMSQVIPGALDMAFQKANGAVTVALAARLGQATAAAFDVLTQMSFCINTFIWGLSCGFSIIIAHRLGAGQPIRAKGALKAGIICVYTCLVFFTIALWYGYEGFMYWVSNDPLVHEDVHRVKFQVCLGVLLGGGMYLMNECLVKQGRVQCIFWTVPPILWAVGTPICIILTPSMGINGIFWGNIIAHTLAFLVLCIHVYRSDWEEISATIRVRAEVAPRIPIKKAA